MADICLTDDRYEPIIEMCANAAVVVTRYNRNNLLAGVINVGLI